MYIVVYKGYVNVSFEKFECLDEAQEYIKRLAGEGITNISLSKEIPFRLKIDVEF